MNTEQPNGVTPDTAADEELSIQCPLCGVSEGVRCERYREDQSNHLERHAEWLMHLAEIGVITDRGMPFWNSVLLIVSELPEARLVAWRDMYLDRLRHLAWDEPETPNAEEM